MDLPATGGCRCGRLRFEITAPPIFTTACHCRGCQRMTGSAFSLSIAIPTPAFRVTDGVEVPGGADHAVGHRFCAHCLSWVFTRLDGIPAFVVDSFVNVRTTMLDDVPTAPPFIETHVAEGLPWAHTGAQHSFHTLPEPERWSALVDAFAVWHAGQK